ncbi:tRNA isopentenyl-2-thiomethyl-A-37 hydroxylase MiaE [Paludisphaera soli]|uniref:tRNA isopentenyl-2-thiomethyl-A-37 hydroxylase MiaE n=1 Tax=Paludisphaera soli TaxID=2712865 RepID=UPI0013ED6A70|nr:tRNA isopentenyl-2-thiomethyl-A-37 hydroxylase MiaE [Paludisphaera soli]
MSLVESVEDLPLLSRTPDAWAERALREPLALLNDHAFLEKKAAANALDLLNRWPEPTPPDVWTTTLASVAHDEAAHLNSVVRLLTRRGGRLERNHRNTYATALRGLVRTGRGNEELVDRLLISALIEARSCERFLALARCTAASDPELSRFYDRLGASELGHYRVFLVLAGHVLPDDAVQARWRELLEAEARILAEQPPGPRMHSGA